MVRGTLSAAVCHDLGAMSMESDCDPGPDPDRRPWRDVRREKDGRRAAVETRP